MAHIMKTEKLLGRKEILVSTANVDTVGGFHAQADESTPGLSVKEGNRRIVKAGTIYPSNDSKAVGLVLQDYDVTDGDANMAIVTHGTIKRAALPVLPSEEALAAMKHLNFLPPADSEGTHVRAKASPARVAASQSSLASDLKVVYELANGSTFRDGANNTSKWVFDEGSTNLEVKSIKSLAAHKAEFTVNLKSSQQTAAGKLTAKPKKEIISAGQSPNPVVIAIVE